MRYKNWLFLGVAQLVWAMSYAASKIAMLGFPIPVILFLRYGVASLIFVGIWMLRGFPTFTRKNLLGVVAVGCINFFVSQYVQVYSLQYTQSIDASILVLFEPLITMIMAIVLLGEPLRRRLLIATGVSIVGFFMLSDIEFHQWGQWSNVRLIGNVLFLASLVSEATCSVTGKIFTKQNHPIDVIGTMMGSAFLLNTCMHFGQITSFSYAEPPLRSWAAVFFLAIFCSLFAYTIWYKVIQEVEVQVVSLSLFLQPVLGIFVGLLWMNEIITQKATVGALLICASLFWWQWKVTHDKAIS
ncbi:MAG: DMT family transporter [Bdellovibrionota bacterium]